MLRDIEKVLLDRGLPEPVRRLIRESKICIIDDKIEDMRSLIDGLKREGFTHLISKQKVQSINELIEGRFDLIILDLKGVAEDLSTHDGVGVLSLIKRADAALPVLVVSGSTLHPTVTKDLIQADLIRSKPVLPADLANDVEELLKSRKEKFWAAYSILKELRTLSPEIIDSIPLKHRIYLWWIKKSIEKSIKKERSNVVSQIIQVAKIVHSLGKHASKIVAIVEAIRNQ